LRFSSDFARFEEEDGLPKHLGQVSAMDLVEDEESPPVLRQPRGFDEPPRPDAEPEASRLSVRRQSHQKVFVGDDRVELDGNPRPAKKSRRICSAKRVLPLPGGP